MHKEINPMTVIKSRFGEDMPWYESAAERDAAIKAYLAHDYSELSLIEIEFMRDCERDPNGTKFDVAHAGVFSEEVDPLDFNGIIFIHNLGRTFEEGRQILLDLIGPHPITPLTLWQAERKIK